MSRWLVIFAFSLNWISTAALASQMAQIVVTNAPVYVSPDDSTQVIDNFEKTQVIMVSNTSYQGYYKVRTRLGPFGWIAEGDITLSKAHQEYSPTAEVERPSARYEREESPSMPPKKLLLMYGTQSFGFGDLLTKFNLLSSDLSPGTSLVAEYSFPLSHLFSMAFRLEYLTSQTSHLQLSATNTQTVSATVIPIELGLIYAAFKKAWFRLNAGGYAGVSIASTSVDQSGVGDVSYNSFSPCLELLLQGDFDLNAKFALDAEVGYRYQTPGAAGASDYFGGGFNIDYSGIFVRAGLEYKF